MKMFSCLGWVGELHTHATARRWGAGPGAGLGSAFVGLSLRVHRHRHKTHNEINKPTAKSVRHVAYEQDHSMTVVEEHHLVTMERWWQRFRSSLPSILFASHIGIILMGKRLPFEWFQGNPVTNHRSPCVKCCWTSALPVWHYQRKTG